MKKLYIIGSGGFSKQVIEIVEEINEKYSEYKIVGLIDDNQNQIGSEVLGYKIIGTTDYLKELTKKQKVYSVIAIANSTYRRKITDKLQSVEWVNLVHPKSTISKYTKMGKGNIICAGTVINPECELGDHCHINIGNTLGHDVQIKNYVTVMPGCRLSGNLLIKENSMIGTGAVILQGLSIEESVTVGAGAVVTKNTESENLYIGIPARKAEKD